MPLEKIISKITRLPAHIYGLKERGILEKGYAADIVIFDPSNITDCATYEEPRKIPKGIASLIVNGKVVMEDMGLSGMLPGKSLKRQGC